MQSFINESHTSVAKLNSSFDDDDEEDCPDPEIIANTHSVEARLLELFEERFTPGSDPTNVGRTVAGAAAFADAVSADPFGKTTTLLPIDAEHAYPCPDTHAVVPVTPPTAWPQCPLLLRPAPESETRIRGVRYSSSKEYLPLPGTGYCAGCTLPINNGTESEGKCLVIDFETNLFIGTAMLRIKDATHPFEGNGGDDDGPVSGGGENIGKDNHVSSYYFGGKKRTFQAVVRGRFVKPNIPMSECITGQIFRRPAGKLPPKWILQPAVSLMSTLAPQLQANFDGNRPRFLSPLVSTAQTVVATRVENAQCLEEDSMEEEEQRDHACDRLRRYRLYPGADSSIESPLVEPWPTSEESLHQDLLRCNGTPLPCPKDKAHARIKARKRAFDKLYARKAETPCFDTEKEYTFEFFQHLLLFEDFAIDLGRAIGQHKLSGILAGQPLKFMAAHQGRSEGRSSGKGNVGGQINWLWNFDIWHESLHSDAVRAGEKSSKIQAVPSHGHCDHA